MNSSHKYQTATRQSRKPTNQNMQLVPIEQDFYKQRVEAMQWL